MMKKTLFNRLGQSGNANSLHSLKVWYQGLEMGQRRTLQIGGGLLILFVGFKWAVFPAWQTLRLAPQAQAQAEAQWVAAQTLVAQAQTLRGRNALSTAGAAEILHQLTQDQLKEKATFLPEAGALGSQFANHPQQSYQGRGVDVQMSEVSPQVLIAWLEQVRIQAHAQVIEVQWNSGPKGWSGKVVFRLPSGPV